MMYTKIQSFRPQLWARVVGLNLALLLAMSLGLSALPARLAQAAPATPQAWTLTGSMSTVRRYHQALLLLNGKVLVVGGRSADNAYLTSVELYDPETGLWSITGSLDSGRIGHTLTMLPDGQILLVGGSNSSGSLTNVKLYDPTTGVWRNTGALNTPRANHTATRLENGKVLVAGGSDSGASRSAEVYDPTTELWTVTRVMNTARSGHAAARLPDGKVLVVGGSGSSATELYDPATGAWSLSGNTVRYRAWGVTAALLPNNKVLLVGGAYYDNNSGFYVYPSETELYDPNTRTWSLSGALGEGAYVAVTVLPNGKVMKAGGYWYQFDPPGQAPASLAEAVYWEIFYSSTSVYDPATGNWSGLESMSTSRAFHTVTVLPTGRVLVVGGTNSTGGLSSAELSGVYPYAYRVYWPLVGN